jgi:hypothetical protein
MPIVTCPKCQERYDPGIDQELADLPAGTSLKVICPKCGQWLRLPEQEPIDAPNVSPDVAEAMREQSRPADGERARPWGDDEGRPRRRRRDDHDDELDRWDDDRRERGWRDQAMDDYTDDPLDRRPPADGLGIASMVIGIVAVVMTFPGFCCFPINFLSLPVGAVCLVMAFVSRRQGRRSGFSLAGLILGLVATVLSAASIVFHVVWLAVNMP